MTPSLCRKVFAFSMVLLVYCGNSSTVASKCVSSNVICYSVKLSYHLRNIDGLYEVNIGVNSITMNSFKSNGLFQC